MSYGGHNFQFIPPYSCPPTNPYYMSGAGEAQYWADFFKKQAEELAKAEKEKQDKAKRVPKYFPWAHKQISTGKMLLFLMATAPFTGMFISWLAMEFFTSWYARMKVLVSTFGI